MENHFLISIIVPIYNKEKYLDSCIRSICNQTYSNLEIILIDDGSSDSSARICDDWGRKDNRIIVKHISNQGVGNARNLGINLSSGDAIMFVDADDMMGDKCVEALANSYINNHVDLIVSGIRILNSSKKDKAEVYSYYKTGLYDIKEYLDALSKYNVHFYFNGPYAKLYSKSVILYPSPLQFEKNDSLGEDFVFMMKFLERVNAVYVIEAANYYYRIDSINSLSKSKHNSEYFFNRFIKMLGFYERLLKEHDVYDVYLDNVQCFKNKIVKIVIRNIVFDEAFSTDKEIIDELSKIRDYFLKQKFLDINPHTSIKAKISCFLLQHRQYNSLIKLIRLNHRLK